MSTTSATRPDSPASRPSGRTLLDVHDVEILPTDLIAKDPVAAYYITSLEEVLKETTPFDVVIVGGGAVGSALVDTLLNANSALRVLLLEKGPFLLPEHVQNVDSVYQPLIEKAVARPWKIADPEWGEIKYDLAPQIPYLGGRALFWSTWIPRPKKSQMDDWPQKVRDDLNGLNKPPIYWDRARRFLGAVHPSDMGPEFTALQPFLLDHLHRALKNRKPFLPSHSQRDLQVELASRATSSSLGYRKFSPVPVLLRYARTHRERFKLVTGCEVTGINHRIEGGHPSATSLKIGETVLPLNGARVVLANGVVEPTGLLLRSFPTTVLPTFAGTNLGGHIACWFTARVPRGTWPEELRDKGLQIGCAYLEGRSETSGEPRDFHIDLMAASNPHPDTATADLYRLIPDSFDQDFLTELSDKDHIGFMVNALGEWRSTPKEDKGSRVSVSGNDTVVHLVSGPADKDVLHSMDDAAQKLVKEVLTRGDSTAKVQYWKPAERANDTGEWIPKPPDTRLKKALVHESGTLWMGATPADSVTDLHGRLHTVSNVYVAGAATFPSSGSWNPTLTAVALAMRQADHLIETLGK